MLVTSALQGIQLAAALPKSGLIALAIVGFVAMFAILRALGAPRGVSIAFGVAGAVACPLSGYFVTDHAVPLFAILGGVFVLTSLVLLRALRRHRR